MISVIRVFIRCGCLLLALLAISIIWQEDMLSFLALRRFDPVPETQRLLLKNRYAEAASYLGFFMKYDYVREDESAQVLMLEIAEKRADWHYKLQKIGEGVFQGTSDEIIGTIACVATDLFVFGDMRDLTLQMIHFTRGDDVDEVLVALSSIGLLASGAQIAGGLGIGITGGTSTFAAAGATGVKSGMIMLKTARKIGKLPSWLVLAIKKGAKTARDTRSLGRLQGVMKDVSILAETPGGFHLLAATTDAVSLRRMAGFAQVFGEESVPLLRIGGPQIIPLAFKVGKREKATVMLAATYGQGGIRLLDKVGVFRFSKLCSRGTKIAFKGDAVSLIADMLLHLPRRLLYFLVVLGAVSVFPRRLFRRGRLRRRGGLAGD